LSGVILLSVSVTACLLFIVAAVDSRSAPSLDIVALILITFILIGLGIYCVKRGRKSVDVELSQKDRELAGFVLGVALIAIGIWVAIIFLPTVPVLSFLLFVLIAGVGVLLGHKLKDFRWFLYGGLAVAGLGYAFVTTVFPGPSALCETINDALIIDLYKTVVPVAVLGTFAFAWLGRKKLAPDRKILTAFIKVAFFNLLIITPFIFGGLHDYNRRWDTSPPQVIQLKVVDKWTQWSTDDYGEWYRLKGETLDGSRRFSFVVSESFYNEHDIGSMCWVRVRSGALGYAWVEGYGD